MRPRLGCVRAARLLQNFISANLSDSSDSSSSDSSDSSDSDDSDSGTSVPFAYCRISLPKIRQIPVIRVRAIAVILNLTRVRSGCSPIVEFLRQNLSDSSDSSSSDSSESESNSNDPAPNAAASKKKKALPLKHKETGKLTHYFPSPSGS